MAAINGKTVRLLALAGVALAAWVAGTGTGQAPPPAAATRPGPRASTRFDLPGVGATLLKPFEVFRPQVIQDKQLVGYIDWSAKKIVAVGRSVQAGAGPAAALLARRGAATIALRNATARSVGVRIGINGRIDALKNGTLVVQALVKDFKVTRTYSRRIGGRTWWYAEVHVPMFGIKGVAAKLFDDQLQAHRVLARQWRRPAWVAPAKAELITGDVLVIDARGLGYNASMYPLVLGGGQILIDMETVPKATAVDHGLCAYGTTKLNFGELQSLYAAPPSRVELAAGAAPAWQNVDGIGLDRLLLAQAAAAPKPPATGPATRATTRPRRKSRRRAVRAIRATGKDKSVLVVADKDALKLLKDPAAAGLARGGRVLVVVDAAAAGVEGRLHPRPEGRALEIASRLR